MKTGGPRLRMFAGPNGSGKSTIKSVLSPELLAEYINPDDIEQEIRDNNGLYHVGRHGVQTTAQEVLSFFQESTLLKRTNLLLETSKLRYHDGSIHFSAIPMNAYFASVTADFIRQKLLERATTFTFETVMSSADKLELLAKAR